MLTIHSYPSVLLQIGGNSLQAGALCSRLRVSLGLERAIPLVWVLEAQTIEALAARLADTTAVEELPSLSPLTATVSLQHERSRPAVPLSFEQVGPH